MPAYVVELASTALNEARKAVNGSKILILGVAYKKDIDDPRESPAFEVIELLLRLGARVSYHDPHIPQLPKMRKHDLRLSSQPLTEEFLASQDCVLIVTDHTAGDWNLVLIASRLVVAPPISSASRIVSRSNRAPPPSDSASAALGARRLLNPRIKGFANETMLMDAA